MSSFLDDLLELRFDKVGKAAIDVGSGWMYTGNEYAKYAYDCTLKPAYEYTDLFFSKVGGLSLSQETGGAGDAPHASIIDIAGWLAPRSTIRTRWASHAVDTILNKLGTDDPDGEFLATKIAKLALLLLTGIAFISIDVVLIPFYVAERCLSELSGIFTDAFFNPKYNQEKLYFRRFMSPVFERLAGAILSPIDGIGIGISGILIDFNNIMNQIDKLELSTPFYDYVLYPIETSTKLATEFFDSL